MGKKFRGRNKGGSAGTWANHRGRTDYAEIEKSNHLLEAFYDELEIVSAEDKETFWKFMKTDLPNSFRFTGSRGHALAVQQRLIDHYIPQITAVEFNGELVEAPKQVEWFPEKLAWSMTTPKQVIRKFAPFSSFQKFLVSETSVGNISRQEIVSMIPPLLMDIKPGMTVLDMCAAPGSKSAQLIEMVHRGEEARIRKVLHDLENEQQRPSSPDGKEVELERDELEKDGDWSDDGRATGLLIANDSDYRRAQMLVHQVKRLNSPNLIVTNHDASIFPSIKIASKPGSQTARYLKFDRVLADVPCTGDGTVRKNGTVWKEWLPTTAMGLHNLQTRILVRALQMLKVGGRAVYSTCSLNPVENEAVVASAIEACGGLANVKIVDCKDQLPLLKRYPGMKSWKLMDRQKRFFSTWEELEAAKSNDETTNKEMLLKFTQSMFPRASTTEEETIPLDRCMRVYPHLQDTGGFFITVLEKTAEIRVNNEHLKKPPKTNGKAASSAVEKLKEEDTTMDDAPSVTPTADEEVDTTNKRKREDEEVPGSSTKKSKSETEVQDHTPEPPAAVKPGRDTDQDVMTFKPKNNQPHEEPYKYLNPNHDVLENIFEFYNLPTRFPRDRFMVRNAAGDPVKAIYYTSDLVRDILVLNEGKGMKFVQAGVKMFMRQDAQGQDICRWRIQGEGTPIIESWVGEERIIRLNHRKHLKKLLIEMFIKIGSDTWPELGQVGQDIKNMSMGCCLLRIEPSDEEDGFKERLVFPLWRSIAAANIMLPKEERKAMLLRLYNDDSPLIDHSQKQAKDSKIEKSTSVGAQETLNQVDDPVFEAIDSADKIEPESISQE